LPERYRQPLVLCYLLGWTNDEAARELGCPKGTFAVRLARARDRLRHRMRQRDPGLFAALPVLSAAAVPRGLVSSTCTLVSVNVVGRAAAAPALNLANGEVTSMFFDKCKAVVLALLTAGILAGVGLGARKVLAEGPPVPETVVAAAPLPEEKKERTPADERSAARIKDLLTKRQKAAAERYAAQYEQFEGGRGSLEIILDSCACLVKSDLELARSKEERVAGRQEHLNRVKKILEMTAARHGAGRVGSFDLKNAEYAALDAEIELEREKMR
jgi:hypothetical protein